MVSDQIRAWSGDERGQTRDEVERIEDELSGSICPDDAPPPAPPRGPSEADLAALIARRLVAYQSADVSTQALLYPELAAALDAFAEVFGRRLATLDRPLLAQPPEVLRPEQAAAAVMCCPYPAEIQARRVAACARPGSGLGSLPGRRRSIACHHHETTLTVQAVQAKLGDLVAVLLQLNRITHAYDHRLFLPRRGIENDDTRVRGAAFFVGLAHPGYTQAAAVQSRHRTLTQTLAFARLRFLHIALLHLG